LKNSLIVTFLAFAVSPGVFAQGDARTEANRIFLRAAELSDLRVESTQAFELHAHIEIIGTNGKSQDGTYLLLWASQNRWHEEINLAGYRRVRFGDVGKYWQVRNTDFEFEAIHELDEMLRFVSSLRRLSEPPVRIKHKKLEGEPISCVESSSAEFCFSDSEGALIREQWHGGKFSARSYENYKSFGIVRFPQTIRTFRGGKPIITFAVDTLIPLPEIAASVFTPPARAESWETCSKPTFPLLTNREMPHYEVNQIAGTVKLYGIVALDGTLQNVKVLDSPDSGLKASAVEAVQRWRFQPATCSGTPLRTETEIDVHFDKNGIEIFESMFDHEP